MVGRKLVRERTVFHIGGYDGLLPVQAHHRFVREMRRFTRTWSIAADVSSPAYDDDQAVWQVSANARGWRVSTYFHLIRWDDIINVSLTEPMWRWVPRGLSAFADFLWAGALRGYLRTNWRYALFFLYPFILFACLVAISVIAAWQTGIAAGSVTIGAVAGWVTLVISTQLAARFLYLQHLFEDWIFSLRYIRFGDPTLEARLERLATQFVSAAQRENMDEVVIIGHSLGAVLAIDLVDRISKRGLRPTEGGVDLAIISVGSSILKIGLHSGASQFRAAVQRVAESHLFFWVDYQARIDMMNFFRTDPLPAMGLPANGRPVVRLVRIRRMLDPDAYRRICRNLFRIHCQFVSGNDRRYSYDYNMFVCGPFNAQSLVETEDGAISLLDENGGICPAIAPTGA